MVDVLSNGGSVLWCLVALSVLSLAIIIFVSVRLFTANLSLARRDKDMLLSAGDESDIIPNSPFARLAIEVLNYEQAGYTRDEIAPIISARATSLLSQLRNGMRVLELIAGGAPLLGLLGTVLGMIAAFQQLETAGSQVDPALLSGGIWQALLTTAAGIIVALPALAAWHFLDRKLETARVEINSFLTERMAFTQAGKM